MNKFRKGISPCRSFRELLLGVLFCFAPFSAKLKPAPGRSPFPRFCCCPLFLLFVNLGYLQHPPLRPYVCVTHYLFLLPKQKRLATGNTSNYLLSGNVHGLPALFRQQSTLEYKNKNRVSVFVTSHKVNFIVRQCFWGRLWKGEKRKIDREWLIASFYQAGPVVKELRGNVEIKYISRVVQ